MDRPRGTLTGVLLAAGSASRFGGGKLLAPLADGTAIGSRSLLNLIACVDRVIAVVRPEDKALARTLAEHGADVTECPYAANGMGQSLAWAIRATPLAKAWVVALADMPWTRTATLLGIVEALKGDAALVAPSYLGARGHPVGFSRRYFGELAALTGDEGAKDVVRKHSQELRLIAVDDPGAVRDVDTPADLTR